MSTPSFKTIRVPCCEHEFVSVVHPQPAMEQAASSSSSLAEQKHCLTAVPAGLLAAQRAKSRRLGKGKSHPLVRDGRVVSKLFNPVAGRPQPTLTSLQQMITVTLSMTMAALSTNVTVPSYGAWFFTLALCPSYAAYTALFDQYRVEQLEVWLEPLNDSTAVVTTPFASAVDLDDANNPASYGDVSDRQGAILGTTLSGQYHKWKPHMATAVYSGAFTSFANEPADWIDVASPNVQHYGLKAATAGADGVARAINCSCRAVVSFRAPAI